MTEKVLSRARARMSAVLNRPVLTESDKETFRELKTRIIDESVSKKKRLAEARIPGRLQGLTVRLAEGARIKLLSRARTAVGGYESAFHVALEKTILRMRDLFPARMKASLAEERSRRPFTAAKTGALRGYSWFRLWLKTPVTVGTVLTVLAAWSVSVGFPRLGFPWSEIGYTSGYGAIFLTAAMTARLTVNSQRLWLEHPPMSRENSEEMDRRKASEEIHRRIAWTTPARRDLVVHEIEQFLASGLAHNAKEINLKANAFLMRKSDWQSLQNAINDTFMRGAPPLLFELGHRLGASVARDVVKLGDSSATLLLHLEEVSRTLGWGIITVTGDLVRGSRLTFSVRESPFCLESHPAGREARSCHMLCGMMSGIAEELWGWPCSSFEQRCVRDGGDCCKIVVTQAIAPPVDSGRWKLSVLFPELHPWSR